MRFAKLIGEDQNPCYSRQIGAVIVNPDENRIVGTGYNGPPKEIPHCDHMDWLGAAVWPQLTDTERKFALKCDSIDETSKTQFVERFSGCKVCPRRIVGTKTGERLELCSCAHSEANAIINSSESLRGCWMFCYCGVPCSECAKLIINKQIGTVVCLSRYVGSEPKGGGNNYDVGARLLFGWSGIKLIECDPDELVLN